MQQGHLQPRRSPPRESVSLPAQKRRKLEHTSEPAAIAAAAATAAYQKLSEIQFAKQDSGESGSSDQSANKWFDNVNRHVKQNDNAGAQDDDEDDDPPFYMTAQDDSFHINPSQSTSGRQFGVSSRLDSENEDLRGVIDDLTVENKKLKHILRSRQSRGSSRTPGDGQDKLFEVRMHRLPPEKRRELEFLLKNFVTSVHKITPTRSISTATSGMSSTSVPDKHIPTDSGYASNSNSGQTSGQTSLLNVNASHPLSKRVKDRNVKNYLHDIPDALLPRQQSLKMTEHAKMALVVRRLEQLFTGKRADLKNSVQSQQQEGPRIVARTTSGIKRARVDEGKREAHILPADSKVSFEPDTVISHKRARGTQNASESTTDTQMTLGSPAASPEQRPTRPTDLDLHREQVAAENIQYIRHLGLSSPRLEHSGEPTETSWLYLNLLFNMAQLHTINVTPEFVRKAVKTLSKKLELSKDGARVRWAGGLDFTTFSKEEEKALENIDEAKTSVLDGTAEDSGAAYSNKRSKTDSSSHDLTSTSASDLRNSNVTTSKTTDPQISHGAVNFPELPSGVSKPSSGTTFDYKPIIYRVDKAREGDDAYLQDTSSSYGSSSRDSSGLVQALSRSNLKEQRGSDEGLITYFANPYFCSDYSGDKLPSNLVRDKVPLLDDVLGIGCAEDMTESVVRYHDACYFTARFGPTPIRMDDKQQAFKLDLAHLQDAGQDEVQPLELPASGIGNIVPADHFAIDVKTGMFRRRSNRPTYTRTIPVTGSRKALRFDYRVLRSAKVDLLPARLPPPSYIFFTTSSSSGMQDEDDDSDEDSSELSSSADADHVLPPAFLRHWTTDRSGGTGDSGGDDADDDNDSDSDSVDMLAEARAADPQRIAEEERQYIIDVPGGRAVAGSLAATVGASGSSAPSRAGSVDTESSDD